MSTDVKQRLVIFDGNAIIHRAYHAIPPLRIKDGTMVNAVYGFTSTLLKVVEDLKPTHLAVSFDVAGKTFRDDVYEKYKATRVKADQDLYDQIPLVYEMVRTLGISIYTKEGYEADDVIGTIASTVKGHRSTLVPSSERGKTKSHIDVIIVTGDMDMLQLVDDTVVKVYELRKGLSDIILFDDTKVKEKYGFGPENIVDYKALRGDVSDNIPGVKGIGEKTAKQLLDKIGGIEEIYTHVRNTKDTKLRSTFSPSIVKKLELGEEAAYMSKKLASIEVKVPGLGFKLKDCVFKRFDVDAAAALFYKFEFFSLLKRLGGKVDAKKENKKIKEPGIILVTQSNVAQVLSTLHKEKQLLCKEILGNSDVLSSQCCGLVCVASEAAYFFDWEKLGKNEQQNVCSFFTHKDRYIIGHDIKEFIKALLVQGWNTQGKIFDVMIASYVLNSGTRAHDLKTLVARELHTELPTMSDQGTLFGVDPSIVASELRFVHKLFDVFDKALDALNDHGLFEKIEMALIPVLAQMELLGVNLDTKALEILSKEVVESLDRITKKIWKICGTEFNVASSTQLRDVLFEKLHIPVNGIKKGKTGYSTAASELEKLRSMHPVIEMIEEYRELAKLQNTYIDVLPKLINKRTGRLHTHFNQAVAATGRLSSSDPNLQNIPIRTELGKKIRNAFISAPGFTLIAADYSQFELRIAASLAKDKRLIEIFNRGEDVHTATAAAIHDVALKDVTEEMRYAAKAVNFGILYGMGSYGLSWRAGIPQNQAKEFIDTYFQQFSGIKKYVEETIAFAKKEGYVETLFGRRRYIPELASDNYQIRSAGERMAVNMPIQGTQADFIKLAMIQIHQKILTLANGELVKDIRMILQVHDELVFEVKEEVAEKLAKDIKKIMENISTLSVPVEVHVGIGKKWGEIK